MPAGPEHSDNSSQPAPASPEVIGKGLSDQAVHVSQGDAGSAQSLSQWVHGLQQDGSMNEIGTAMSRDNSANVVRDSSGKVTELVFDHTGGKPVDVKIASNGDVSVDGRNPDQLRADDTASVKRNLAEAVQKDSTLSPAAKEQVTRLESAMLDGNSQAVIDGLKSLQGNDEIARDVTARLNKDLSPVAEIQYEQFANAHGGSSFRLNSTESRTSTYIAPDGKATTFSLDYSGQPTGTTESNKAIATIGSALSDSKSLGL